MIPSRTLASAYQPLIRFVGKRTVSAADHTASAAAAAHPASPTGSLPPHWTSFASYRQGAQQHGPLGTASALSTSRSSSIGSLSGASLGPVSVASSAIFFDRSELPARFRRVPLLVEEIEAVESGGASLF